MAGKAWTLDRGWQGLDMVDAIVLLAVLPTAVGQWGGDRNMDIWTCPWKYGHVRGKYGHTDNLWVLVRLRLTDDPNDSLNFHWAQSSEIGQQHTLVIIIVCYYYYNFHWAQSSEMIETRTHGHTDNVRGTYGQYTDTDNVRGHTDNIRTHGQCPWPYGQCPWPYGQCP